MYRESTRDKIAQTVCRNRTFSEHVLPAKHPCNWSAHSERTPKNSISLTFFRRSFVFLPQLKLHILSVPFANERFYWISKSHLQANSAPLSPEFWCALQGLGAYSYLAAWKRSEMSSRVNLLLLHFCGTKKKGDLSGRIFSPRWVRRMIEKTDHKFRKPIWECWTGIILGEENDWIETGICSSRTFSALWWKIIPSLKLARFVTKWVFCRKQRGGGYSERDIQSSSSSVLSFEMRIVYYIAPD